MDERAAEDAVAALLPAAVASQAPKPQRDVAGAASSAAFCRRWRASTRDCSWQRAVAAIASGDASWRTATPSTATGL